MRYCDTRRPRVMAALLLASACASAPIGDGFTGGDGVFSTTMMTATWGTGGDTDVDPSQGSMTTSAEGSMTTTDSVESSTTDSESDSDADSDAESDASDVDSDADSGPGPTTDDTNAESSSSGGDDGPKPFCGDGVTDPGEACDDGDADDTDECLSSCEPASCGDAIVHVGVEICDDGVNDGAYGGCNGGCGSLAAYCGDAAVQMQELCDPGVALPWANVGCENCTYDFSAIPQLYCNGSCTWAGGESCDQADADIYCKLVTGDANSVATSFSVVFALDQPGFACPGYGTNLGTLPTYGVNVSVWYQDTSILANHGSGEVVSNVQCS